MSSYSYMLHPGRIASASDGDWHWVGARRLMQLYNLHPDQVVVCPACQHSGRFPSAELRCAREMEDYIHLFPRYLGDYSLPKEPNSSKNSNSSNSPNNLDSSGDSNSQEKLVSSEEEDV